MGWNPFKSKTKITVSTSVSRVIEDKLLPDSAKAGLIAGLFSGDGQIVEHVMEELVHSVAIRANQMYTYGKNHYIHGLPSNSILSDATGKEQVQAVIEDIEGRPVTIEYYKYGVLNNLHYGWKTLTESYNYNPFTNVIGSLTEELGFPVYLTDLQVMVIDATVEELNNCSLEQWGTAATAGYSPLRPVQIKQRMKVIAPTQFGVDSTAMQDYFRVTYAWTEATTTEVDGKTFTTTEVKTELTT